MSGKPGMRKRAPMRETSARQRMWNAMRRLRRFTTADLESTAEAGNNHARKYVQRLLVAGYLRVAQAKREGVTGGHAVYSLARDTGPFAPRFGKDQSKRLVLLDPNLEPARPLPGQEPVLVPRADYDRALKCVRACAGMDDPEAEIAALRSLSPLPLRERAGELRSPRVRGAP